MVKWLTLIFQAALKSPVVMFELCTVNMPADTCLLKKSDRLVRSHPMAGRSPLLLHHGDVHTCVHVLVSAGHRLGALILNRDLKHWKNTIDNIDNLKCWAACLSSRFA